MSSTYVLKKIKWVFYGANGFYLSVGCKDSIAVIVSPLISLMMDQRQKIIPRGLLVEFVREAHTDDNWGEPERAPH